MPGSEEPEAVERHVRQAIKRAATEKATTSATRASQRGPNGSSWSRTLLANSLASAFRHGLAEVTDSPVMTRQSGSVARPRVRDQQTSRSPTDRLPQPERRCSPR